MPTREQLEAMLVQHLGVLGRITNALCHRHGLRGADADDFAAWVRLRVVENDYAILARYRGGSALATYLTAVVSTLFLDWQVRRTGRWRPSAAALHAGPPAVSLERLLHRDGLPFEQAARIVQMQEVPPPTLRDLVQLARMLPRRVPLRPAEVGPGPLEQMATDAGSPEVRVTAAEDAAMRQTVERALARALAALPAEDRVLLRMRFWEGASVADVARALAIPQKPLYARLERLFATLRAALASEGVDARSALDVIGTDRDGTAMGILAVAPDTDGPRENGTFRPSNHEEGRRVRRGP